MNSREMKQSVKFKINKTDSKQNRNYLTPEIDWVLNEATDLYISLVLHPKKAKEFGWYEKKRTLDDIRTLVKTVELEKIKENIFELPEDLYIPLPKHLAVNDVLISKGKCKFKKGKLELFEAGVYDENNLDMVSSFEWRDVKSEYINDKQIKTFTDGTFTVEKVYLTYIKKPAYIHNAGDFRGGSYKKLTGEMLTGYQDSDLPESTHREICDLASLLLVQQALNPDIKNQLLQLNIDQLNN